MAVYKNKRPDLKALVFVYLDIKTLDVKIKFNVIEKQYSINSKFKQISHL